MVRGCDLHRWFCVERHHLFDPGDGRDQRGPGLRPSWTGGTRQRCVGPELCVRHLGRRQCLCRQWLEPVPDGRWHGQRHLDQLRTVPSDRRHGQRLSGAASATVDTLTGNSGNDTLNGYRGADVISGPGRATTPGSAITPMRRRVPGLTLTGAGAGDPRRQRLARS